MRRLLEPQRSVLVVLPHPDDESGMSGTIAYHVRNGTPVTYVCMTLGEMGRNMGKPLFANRATLPLIRKQELLESCRAIGIEDVRMWGLHDKMVEFEDREALVRRIEDVIAEVNPSLVMTYYPGYSVHPDHNACGDAVVKAVERMPEERRPTVYCVAFSQGCEEILGPPDVINDVSAFYKQKIGSYLGHRSQFQLMLGTTNFEDPELKARLGRERYWTYRFS